MATPATPVESQYVDFGRAFQFFFEDPEWQKKTLMGSLLRPPVLILVGLPFLAGYGMAGAAPDGPRARRARCRSGTTTGSTSWTACR